MLKSFTLLLLLPNLLFAQKAPECGKLSEAAEAEIELSLLAGLSNLQELSVLKGLSNLQELSELKNLSHLQELSELKHLSRLQKLGDLQQLAFPQPQPDPEPLIMPATSYSAEKQRTVEKTYKVGSSDMLSIQNKFGKVHVNTWDRKEIHVAVTMISRASTEQKAQETLDNIKVTESRDGKTISWITELAPIKVRGNNQRSFEINYIVSMPARNPLTVVNSFGDVYLASFKGKADITVKYGSLKTGQLSNASNHVKVSYGSANCGYINGGNVDIAYSSMDLEGTNGLQGSSKFSSMNIGSLQHTLDMSLKHGSLRVDNISRNVNKINVDGGFSPIALNFEDNSAFNFDVNVQFGSFNFDKDLVNVSSLEKSHTSAAYKGKYGNAASKGSVNIVSKYGDVKFTK
ncbi:DUF4097 family beta strand repeat-containing protein [Pontibacter beigongshangensis]|uniref:hypothetical protein n=1 Tax=Pontibacter beigongshangensis TaxID=2574733 RepID=UPI001F50DC2C|nr:hypothetical protein [Pontibacter beigongshangensis]